MAQHYQDNLGGWHELPDASFEHLLSQNHPSLTFTQKTRAEYDAAVNPPPTPAEQFKAIERAIEQHMDEVAKADGWDNRWTCVARAGYVNPWQAKGIKFAQWMDDCWVVAIKAQNDVIAGLRQIPTPEEAVLELPAMVW